MTQQRILRKKSQKSNFYRFNNSYTCCRERRNGTAPTLTALPKRDVPRHQFVTGTPSTSISLPQNTLLYQVLNITKSRVRRTLGNLSPFTRCQFAIKTVQQAVNKFPLADIHLHLNCDQSSRCQIYIKPPFLRQKTAYSPHYYGV